MTLFVGGPLHGLDIDVPKVRLSAPTKVDTIGTVGLPPSYTHLQTSMSYRLELATANSARADIVGAPDVTWRMPYYQADILQGDQVNAGVMDLAVRRMFMNHGTQVDGAVTDSDSPAMVMFTGRCINCEEVEDFPDLKTRAAWALTHVELGHKLTFDHIDVADAPPSTQDA